MLSRRGNYSALTGLSVLVLMGFAALSVDFARLYTAKSQIQSNTDAAVLAALTVYRNEVGTAATPEASAQAAANYIFDQNVVAEEYGKVDMQFSMGIYDWDAAEANPLDHAAAYTAGAGAPGEKNAVQVTGTRTDGGGTKSVDTLLAPVFGGPSQVDVDADAISAFRYRDIILVTDTTRSLETPEITQVRLANNVFLSTLEDIQVPGDKISLVAFTGEGSLVSELQDIKDADSYRTWFENVTNCRWDADHYYFYWYADVDWSFSGTQDHPFHIYPYKWSKSLQGTAGSFDWDLMLDGADDVLGGDNGGEAERRFIAKFDGGSASRNWSWGSVMPPCNNGRNPGEFYGPSGYWMSNYPGASIYTWNGPGDPGSTKWLRTGTKYSSWSDSGSSVSHERYNFFSDTGTNQYAAMQQAKIELDSPRARSGSLQAVVLITDGLPQAGAKGAGSSLDKSLWLENLARTYAQSMCTDGVSIFTVSYNTAGSTWDYARQSDFLHDLAEDPYGTGETCNYGKFYETPDASDLPAILEEIARKLPIILVQ